MQRVRIHRYSLRTGVTPYADAGVCKGVWLCICAGKVHMSVPNSSGYKAPRIGVQTMPHVEHACNITTYSVREPEERTALACGGSSVDPPRDSGRRGRFVGCLPLMAELWDPLPSLWGFGARPCGVKQMRVPKKGLLGAGASPERLGLRALAGERVRHRGGRWRSRGVFVRIG